MRLPVCTRVGLPLRGLLSLGVAGVLLLTPSRHLFAEASDYLTDVWDTESRPRLPNSSVTSVAQTPDGYLWVGTYDGLARFDGVRFVTFDLLNTPELGQARVQDLQVDAEGTLWINTYRGGLTSCRNGVFCQEWEGGGEFDLRTSLAWSSSNTVVFVAQFGDVLRRTARPGLPVVWETNTPPGGARLKYQCTGSDGVLWLLSREGRILRVVDREFKPLPDEAGLAGQQVLTVAADLQGRIWVGTDHGIARWSGNQFEAMTPTNGEPWLAVSSLLPTRDGGLWVLADGRLRKQVNRRWVAEADEWRGLLGSAAGRNMGMHEDRDGGVWFNHYGNGLFHVTRDGRFERFTARDGLPGDRIGAWFQGREGDIWVGVDRGGLARLREKRFQVIGQAEGLPARAAFSVCEDQAGALWIGTSGGGLCRWHDGKIESFPVGNDFSANFVFSAVPVRSQELWLSASAGEDLYVCRDGQIQRGPWEVHGLKSILVDRSGRIWMGTKTGLDWWESAERRWSFTSRTGMRNSAVRALAEDKNGVVWCGTDDGTLYRCGVDRLEAFRPSDKIAPQPIWSLLADDNGIVWAGTFRGGLLRFQDGKFTRLTTQQGLPSDVVGEILQDGRNQLWLGTHQGICRVAKVDLNAYAHGLTNRVECVTYGRLDGLPTLECSIGYQPSCWRARDGRLWFATVRGVVAVKPDEVKSNPLPPPVVLEELRVDGEPLPLDADSLRVPPGHKQFEFRFTAPSFDAPENVRFRYRLEGLDADWVQADTRRTAQYSHLPARDYRFRVRACNSDGVWNETGCALAFTVLPHFYETWWFLGLVGAGIVGGIAAIVRAVITRKYRRALARLEQQHAIERDRARIAKDIHDDLGAGLTQITLLGELARRESPPEASVHLERISESARKMTRAMDEIVWAVDPQHDTLNGLVDYVSAYAEDFLHTAGLRCRLDLPADLPSVGLDAELRHNLFLALKEALNNAVKHAQATEVWLRLCLELETLTLIVEDNGCGLAASGAPNGNRIASGHGLSNLEKRLAAIGGRCVVRSTAGRGTRIEMSVRLKPASPIVVTGQNGSDGAE
jgi:signal transduction histidine kinase/ligand-binding sensor domain-containing protein